MYNQFKKRVRAKVRYVYTRIVTVRIAYKVFNIERCMKVVVVVLSGKKSVVVVVVVEVVKNCKVEVEVAKLSKRQKNLRVIV